MKIKNYLAWMFMAVLSVSTVACSDDDDNNGNGAIGNIGEVFPNGVLTGINRGSQKFISDITRDSEGRVTSMKYYGEIYKIEYASANTVKVTTYEKGDNGKEEAWIRTFTLGANGFINGGSASDEDGTSTWTIGYDAQGHLTSMVNNYKEKDGYSSEMKLNITYDANGDITKYTATEDETHATGTKESSTDNVTVKYTDSKVTTAIENKGNIMFFDQIFGIDLDEDICLYYAGLLGKSTAHLPVSVTSEYKSDNYTGTSTNTNTMVWNLNKDSYPTSVAITEQGYTETFNFVW